MKFQFWAHGAFARWFLVPVLRPSWAMVWVLYQWMSGICAHIGELVHKTASVSVSGTYGPNQAASGYDGLTLSQNQASACRWGTGMVVKTRQYQPKPGSFKMWWSQLLAQTRLCYLMKNLCQNLHQNMTADVPVPTRHQAICIHHADLICDCSVTWIYHYNSPV